MDAMRSSDKYRGVGGEDGGAGLKSLTRWKRLNNSGV